MHASILLTSDKSLHKELIERIRKDLSQWGITLLGTVYNCGGEE